MKTLVTRTETKKYVSVKEKLCKQEKSQRTIKKVEVTFLVRTGTEG